MTVEPGREPFDRERAPRQTSQYTPVQPGSPGQPAHYNAVRHGSHVEESPELLRWRADLLMDEMMMGGVDVSAADGNRTFSGVDAPVVQRPQVQPHPTSNGHNGHAHPNESSRYGNGSYENGGYENGSHENGGNANGRYRNGHEQSAYDHRGAQPGDVLPQGSGSRNGGYLNGSAYDGNGPAPDAPRQGFERDHKHSDNVAHSHDTAGQGYPSPAAHHPVSPETQSLPPHPSPQNFAPRPGAPRDDGIARPVYNGYHDEPDPRGISAPRQYPDVSSNEPSPRHSPSQHHESTRIESEQPPADPYPSTLRTNVEQLPAYGRAERLPDDSPAVGSHEPSPHADRLYAVEQQYEQFRREQSANVQPADPPRPELPRTENRHHEEPPRPETRTVTRPPLPPVEPARYPTTPPRVTPPPVDEHTRWATGPEKWEYQDFGANPQEAEEDSLLGAPVLPERRYAEDSAVRHDPAQFVSAMSVMNNGKKRSTLLPRSTELDVDTLHREISDLHGEIAALLPVGNETSERARHLLDKAYAILQSDPSRSAEVEYYMQQVRTIVLRLRQARQWSDLYRQRLHVYLLGWLGLSAMVLFARFFFQIDLENMLMWVTGVAADSWLVEHWATFVGTAGAGAFGGALGALYTMRGHARGEHSFFDRKYGLRGLILPFMGMIVGMVGYVIFGLVFALVGINPALSLTAAIIPTTAAFAFGFSQESIYGTRG